MGSRMNNGDLEFVAFCKTRLMRWRSACVHNGKLEVDIDLRNAFKRRRCFIIDSVYSNFTQQYSTIPLADVG